MGLINDVTRSQLPEILYRLRALENASPMNNGAVGRSGFEVYDGGTINISSGNLIGAGTFIWQGAFNQSGTTTFSGATTIAGPTGITGALTVQGDTSVTGPFTVTGDTKLNGPTSIGGNTTVTGTFTNNGSLTVNGAMKTTSTLSVEGVTTLKNDLNVTTGGKIKVGSSMTLDPGVSSGALVFSNGAQVFTDATTIQMFKGTSVVQIASGTATLQGTGSTFVRADAAGVLAAGPLRNTGFSTISAVTPNLYMDASGNIKKIV